MMKGVIGESWTLRIRANEESQEQFAFEFYEISLKMLRAKESTDGSLQAFVKLLETHMYSI